MLRSRMMGKSSQQGFTLIELMVTTVILGILLSIGLINLSQAQVRAKNASTRTNMHALQTLVEIYATSHNGFYPSDFTALEDELAKSQVQTLQNMNNPYTRRTGLNQAYALESSPKQAGLTTYAHSADASQYWIYGYGEQDSRIQNRGLDFVLSNGH